MAIVHVDAQLRPGAQVNRHVPSQQPTSAARSKGEILRVARPSQDELLSALCVAFFEDERDASEFRNF
jgi:hypothetical protein